MQFNIFREINIKNQGPFACGSSDPTDIFVLFQVLQDVFLIIGHKPYELCKDHMVLYSKSFLIEFSSKIFYESGIDESLQFIIHIFPGSVP